MNSIWNNNIKLFKQRFPALFQMLSKASPSALNGKTPDTWTVIPARNGDVTVRENGVMLHSSYNPVHEAERIVASSDKKNAGNKTAVFLGFGAGYLPVCYAKAHPEHSLILIEPDPVYLFAPLYLIDWTAVFLCAECVIFTSCPCDTILSFLENKGIDNCSFFSQRSQTAHAAPFFQSLNTLLERNKQKNEINANTLDRFAKLWMQNSCRNIKLFSMLDGVSIYENKAKFTDGAVPAIVLAAGPSLDNILPVLPDLKCRALIICVDAALRSCLAAHVEPDFIILVDPQYWALRHVLGLSSPSSVMITESAAYPAVYRFPCRKTVVCSSLFPLGAYFEHSNSIGKKGKLETGGSVATAAWDFARLIGSDAVYMAGLDLGYPEKKTHIKAGTFEMNALVSSNRFATLDTSNAAVLFSAMPSYSVDYKGRKLLTDKRMQLFAWWFESKAASCHSMRTHILSGEGLFIPGIQCSSYKDILRLPNIEDKKTDFFARSEAQQKSMDEQRHRECCFFQRLSILQRSFDELQSAAKKGESVCTNALAKKHLDLKNTFNMLSCIDSEIMTNDGKDAASLVFPTEKRLENIIKHYCMPQDPLRASIVRSLVIYRELLSAVSSYKKFLFS